jgi:hypothetical protein
MSIEDTLDLRRLLLQSLEDVIEKRITPNEARARAWLAREIVNTVRLELAFARTGLAVVTPVRLLP